MPDTPVVDFGRGGEFGGDFWTLHVDHYGFLLLSGLAALVFLSPCLRHKVANLRMADKTLAGVPLRLRIICFFLRLYLDFTQRDDGSIMRKGPVSFLTSFLTPANPAPAKFGVASKDREIQCSDRSLLIRLFLPNQAGVPGQGRIPIALYFHGGGFCFSSAREIVYDILCRRIASSNTMIVVSVEYRLAPEHRYPAAYDDGTAVLHWLKERAVNEDPWIADHADLSKCFLIGDSAGANIAHHVSLRALREDLGPLNIQGRILLCPFFTGTDRLPSEVQFGQNGYITNDKVCNHMWKSYLPIGASKDHMAANPLSTSHPSLQGLHPTLVQVDGVDYLHDRGVLYAEALGKAGVKVELVKYPDTIHDAALFQIKPERLMADIASFVRGTLSSCQ